MKQEQQRKLAAIMFTDMVGYSALTQKNEALALELLEEHRQLLRPIFPKFGGREIKTIGDAFLVEFASALEATRCAVEMQKILSEHNASAPREKRIQIRIGMHVGDVVHQEKDVFGDGVNIASRIEPLARPGGICISEDVARQIQRKIEIPVRKLGKGELKNIQLPVDIYRIVLPWERERLPFSDRLYFSLRQKRTRLFIGAIIVVSVFAGVSWWIFNSYLKPQLPAAGPEAINSIAVLPLENLSGDPEQEYFSDGMTEQLIADLAQIGALRVISRTSVMRYKGTVKSLPDIARELNVDLVVEGSILRAGDQVRITAQLIEAATDRHLWAKSYERDLRDILALQSEVARAIANEIKVTLTPEEEVRLASTRPVNPDAYGAYLKGRYYWNKRTEEGLKKGVQYFQQAIEKDPGYALAYAGLADSYINLVDWGLLPAKEAQPKARAAAAKALEIDKTLAEAHTSLAYVRFVYEWDWLEAERGFKRALELNHNYATAHQWYAEYLAAMGRFDEAIAEIKRAQELDPLSLIISTVRGFIFFHARQCEQAIEQYQKTMEMDPNFYPAHWWIRWSYEQKGMYEEAVKEWETTMALEGTSTERLAALRNAYTASGMKAVYQWWLEKLKDDLRSKYVYPIVFAMAYVGLGEKDRAFEWLERAYKERDPWNARLKVDPNWDSLRSDPRFRDFMRRMNFPE